MVECSHLLFKIGHPNQNLGESVTENIGIWLGIQLMALLWEVVRMSRGRGRAGGSGSLKADLTVYSLALMSHFPQPLPLFPDP